MKEMQGKLYHPAKSCGSHWVCYLTKQGNSTREGARCNRPYLVSPITPLSYMPKLMLKLHKLPYHSICRTSPLSVRSPATRSPREVAIDNPSDGGDKEKIDKKDQQDFCVAATIGVAKAGEKNGECSGNATAEEIIDDGAAACPCHHGGKPTRLHFHQALPTAQRESEEEIEEKHGGRILEPKQAWKHKRIHLDGGPQRTGHKQVDRDGDRQHQGAKQKTPAHPELINLVDHIAQEKVGQGDQGLICMPLVGLKSQ